MSSLTFRAGPQALALIRERGLRAEDVDIIPAASGGAKWLSIGGLELVAFSIRPVTRLPSAHITDLPTVHVRLTRRKPEAMVR